MMLFNLILGVVAGITSRYVEKPLGGMIQEQLDMPEADLRVLSFVACLLVASLLIAIAGANGMPIVLLIGGALGIFGSHVMKFGREQKDVFQQKLDERKANAGNATPYRAEDVNQDVADAVDEAVEAAKEASTKTSRAVKKTAAKKTTPKKPAAKK
ncbi:hypothetical protein [Paramylibacter kogurei]|nr:hypothetical protein [Amylibacter kogurei]